MPSDPAAIRLSFIGRPESASTANPDTAAAAPQVAIAASGDCDANWAQFVTDPSCLYDAATGRFFVTVLTLETFPNGAYTTVNHLDTAVSQTADPTGLWTIYRTDVTNDGTNTGGVNPGPYLGDYPHIGADANGFYITTNAYPWCCNGFSGAQIYAFSKAQLAAGAANVTMVHLDTSGMVNAPSDAGSTPSPTIIPPRSRGSCEMSAF